MKVTFAKILLAIIFAALFLMALSCRSPQKLIELAEKRGATWKADTVFRVDTLLVEGLRYDTVVKVLDFSDTIMVEKDGAMVKVFVDVPGKTVYVDQECPPDTVILRVPVVVTQTLQAQPTQWEVFKANWEWVLLALCVGFGLAFLAQLIAKVT
jgi:hypothetical protein